MIDEETTKNLIINGNGAIMKLNPVIYSPDIVKAAAYILADKAMILIGIDDEQMIDVKITPKPGLDIHQVIETFNQELLNYSIYKEHSEKNKDLREAIIKRILLTNEIIKAVDEIKRELRDPEGILKPWEDTGQQ